MSNATVAQVSTHSLTHTKKIKYGRFVIRQKSCHAVEDVRCMGTVSMPVFLKKTQIYLGNYPIRLFIRR